MTLPYRVVKVHTHIKYIYIYVYTECSSSCIGCYGGGPEKCLGCPTNKKYFMTTCVDSCPSGTREIDGVCVSCLDPGARTCGD